MSTSKMNLFDAVMAAIPEHGWTRRAVERGAKQAGYSAGAARQAFPQGADSVAAELRRRANAAMQAAIARKRGFAVMRVRDKVSFCVRARLEYLEAYRPALTGMAVWAAMPGQSFTSMRALWDAAAVIWLAAGDTATDYNRYTKRALLVGVMQTTFAFWLRDTSADRQDSWAFLDRRISDVLTLGKGINLARSVGLKDIVSFARSRFAA